MTNHARPLAVPLPGEEARLAETADRERWIAGVKQRLGIITIGERACLRAGNGFTIAMGCPLHDPFLTGAQQELPEFAGLDDLVRDFGGPRPVHSP